MTKPILILTGMILATACNNTSPDTSQPDQGSSSWTSLFNGEDLSGWDTWLGPADVSGPRDETNQPIGLNTDPDTIFSVVEVDGTPAIRISGKYFGGISTHESFDNYHLQLQFKWGEAKWPPRENLVRDSGLLYHGVGEHGAEGGFWLRSQECQIQEGDCGDYWSVGGSSFDVNTIMDQDSNYVFNRNGEVRTFNPESGNGHRVFKSPDAENPTGEWNTVDLYCYADTAIHVINGQVNMILTNSSQLENGELIPLTGGKIQIQTEGAEVFYREIRLQKIDHIPADLIRI